MPETDWMQLLTDAERAAGKTKPTILEDIAQVGLPGLGRIANVLDVPASVGRDLVTWLPGGLEPQNPVDQLLPWNWSNADTRVGSFRDIFRSYGLASEEDTWTNFLTGVGADILTDPLTYLTMGSAASSQGGRAARAAGLADDLVKVAAKKEGVQIGTIGAREARSMLKVSDLVEHAGREGEGALRKYARANKLKYDDLLSQPVGGVYGFNLPSKNPRWLVGPGKTGRKIAKFLDDYSLYPFNMGRKVKDFKIPKTNIRPIGDLEGMVNARIGKAQQALTRVQAGSLFDQKIRNYAGVMQFVGDFAQTLRRNDFASPEAAKLLRGALESTLDAIPEDIPAEVVDMIKLWDAKVTPMVDEANFYGLQQSELVDEIVEIAEGKYFPRYLNTKMDEIGGARWNDPAVYSTSDRSSFGRKQPLKGVQGMTNTVNDMAADETLNDMFAKGASPEQVAEHLRTAYPDVMQNSEFATWDQVQDYRAAKAGGAEDLVNPGMDQYDAFAKWVAHIPEEIRKDGVFGNHPLFDMAERMISHADRISATKMIYETLSQPGVIKEEIEGGVKVSDLFQDLNIKTGRGKQVLRDMMKKNGLDTGPMQMSKSGKKPLTARMVEPQIAEDLKQILEGIKVPEPGNKLLRAWDSVRNLWKGAQTGPWPGFHVRNFMSGQIDNMLAGTWSPKSMKMARQLFRGELVHGAKDLEAVKSIARKMGYQVDDIAFEPGGMRDRFSDMLDDALFDSPTVEHKISRDMKEQIVRLAEARAGVWSIETGLPADEFFAQFKGVATDDFQSFMDNFRDNPGLLLQDHPNQIPLREWPNGNLTGSTKWGDDIEIAQETDGTWTAELTTSQGMESWEIGNFETLKEAKKAAFDEIADRNPSPIIHADMFYSKALRTTIDKVSGPVGYKQFVATMKKAGVDEEELGDLLMESFFGGGKKSPQQIAQHIRRNSPSFTFERVPEGMENYEDIALTSPAGTDYGVLLMRGPTLADDLKFTRSDHGFGDDVIAFGQFDTVPTASGGRALRIQGIQSDLHAEGATAGYWNPDILPEHADTATLVKQLEAAQKTGQPVDVWEKGANVDDAMKAVKQVGSDVIMEDGRRIPLDRLFSRPTNFAPNAPFKKSWAMLMMKRLVRKAVEEGYDEVHLASGSHIAKAVGGPVDKLSQFYDSYLTNKLRRYTKKWKSYEGTQGGRMLPKAQWQLGGGAALPASWRDQMDWATNMVRQSMPINQRRLEDMSELSAKQFNESVIRTARDDLQEAVEKASDGLENAENAMSRLRQGADDEFLASIEEGLKSRQRRVALAQSRLDEFDQMAESGLHMGIRQVADPSGPAPANVFKITDKMRESVMEGQPLYQQFLGEAKGATLFDDWRSTIIAFQGADVSTLAHELGHIFRRDLPPNLQKMARDSIGELVEKVTSSDGTWTRAAEEEFARGFERYLRSGKAPTKELRGVFGKFKQWLTKIYYHLLGSPIENAVSPQLKEVFDRMLGKDMPVRGVLDDKAATDILGQLHYANRIGGRFEGVSESVLGEPERTGRGSYDDIMRQMPQTEFRQFDIRDTAKRFAGRADDTTLNPVKADYRGFAGKEESTFGPMAAGNDIGHYTEFMNRSSPFIEQLRQGVEPTFAGAKVGATQVMYQNKYFTKEEQQVLQRLFPFYKFCVPTSHEILTRRGWLAYDQITAVDEALTLNHSTGELHWQRIQAVNVFEHDGELVVHSLKKNTRKIEWWFTDGHRWPVITQPATVAWELADGSTKSKEYGGERVFRTGDSLQSGDTVPSTGDYREQSTCLSPRHAALLGWIVTDGYMRWRGNSCEAVLYQTPHKHLDEIAELTGSIPRKPHPDTGCCAVNVKATDLAVITEHYTGLQDLCKVVSQLSRASAEAMWDAMMKADGSKHPDGRHKALSNKYDKTPEVSDAFQMLCFLVGKSCNVSPTQCCVRHSKGHKVGVNLERRHYSGKVWCPTTQNGTWIMRHNGAAIITGNSRGKLPWVFDRLWEHPAGGLGRILRVVGDLQGQAEFTPDYVAETASIPLNDIMPSEDPTVDRYLTGFGASFEDPISFVQGPRGAGLEALSRMDPLIKGSLEWITGESFFQKGPMGGRDLVDQDPVIGRTLSNLGDMWTGDKTVRPVQLPDWLEHAAMNSPISRALTTTRQLTDQRKDALTKLVNVGTGIRVSDISEGARDAVVDERLANLKRELGAKSFARTYFREEDKAEMSEEELALAERMEELSNMLAERAKARKAARLEAKGETPAKKKSRKKKASWREARGLE